jgi:hypothetical protein
VKQREVKKTRQEPQRQPAGETNANKPAVKVKEHGFANQVHTAAIT